MGLSTSLKVLVMIYDCMLYVPSGILAGETFARTPDRRTEITAHTLCLYLWKCKNRVLFVFHSHKITVEIVNPF
jgi:hypothetical protein